MYRRATLNDMEVIEKIASNTITKETLEKTLKDNEKYLYVLEDEQRNVIGVTYFGSDDVDNDEYDCEIFGLYTVKDNELKDTIKAEMVFQTERKLYEKGYRNLIVWCDDTDEESKRIYRGIGGIESRKRDNGHIQVAYSFELTDYPEE